MSSKKSLDALGDRLKTFERLETSQMFTPNLPIYVRLDGRGFSNFTKNMNKPYDYRMYGLMCHVASVLQQEFNALVVYTQSDEINLILKNDYGSPCIFGGKKQKLISLLAATASSVFSQEFKNYFPDFEYRAYPTFDARVFNIPSIDEATNCIYWRYLDCVKNSISMLAQNNFSHKELFKKNTGNMIDMLLAKNISWENDIPSFHKYGVLYTKKLVRLQNNVERLVVNSDSIKLNLLTHEQRKDLFFKDSYD